MSSLKGNSEERNDKNRDGEVRVGEERVGDERVGEVRNALERGGQERNAQEQTPLTQSAEAPHGVTRRNLNDLLVETFNSILRIEERSLRNNPLTEGLSISEIHTLCSVGLHERNPMKVIAERLDVTMATLNAAMNRLEKRGFVQRNKNEQDRRQVLVALTNKGRKVVRVHDAFHRKMIDNALSDLTDAEADAMARAVASLKRFFDTENEKGSATA